MIIFKVFFGIFVFAIFIVSIILWCSLWEFIGNLYYGSKLHIFLSNLWNELCKQTFFVIAVWLAVFLFVSTFILSGGLLL